MSYYAAVYSVGIDLGEDRDYNYCTNVGNPTLMIQPRNLAVALAIALAVGACTSPAPSSVVDQSNNPGGSLNFKLASGRFHCELGIEVGIMRDPQNPSQLKVDWNGRTYAMNRNASYSGLPRYENRPSGLVWIDLPWKGILLDSHTGRPLASECTVS
jgi:hypothetical protein